MKKNLFLIFLGLIISTNVISQDAHFTMFYNTPLHLNPALTGAHSCFLRIGTSYKDQWRSVSYPYKTYALFSDVNITSEKIKTNAFGVGLQFLGDRSGTGNLSTNDIRLSMAYHKSLMDKEKLTFSMGISMAYVNHSLHPDQLTFESQWTGNSFDHSLPNNENFYKTSVSFYDMAAGLAVTYTPVSALTTSIGASLSHITQPVYDFFGGNNKVDIKTCLHANINAQLNKKTIVSSRILYTEISKVQEWMTGINITLNNDKTPFYLGLWYRVGRDLIPLAGFDIKGLQVMMTYDFNISQYSVASKSLGGFEISLIKQLLCNTSNQKNSKKYNRNYNNCPKF